MKTVFEDPVRELHGAFTKGGTGKRKQYFRLDAFIHTCLLRDLKPQST